MRVFTGTIPDYSTEVKGLLLGGVIGGGPAEQAGLQKGDVIVEIAGQTIANIYDYTYALDLLKIGQPAKVVYMRDGEKKSISTVRRAGEEVSHRSFSDRSAAIGSTCAARRAGSNDASIATAIRTMATAP